MNFNLGQKIAQLRKNNNLSQKDLAEKLNVSNKTISGWECGRNTPNFEDIQKLSTFSMCH